MSDDACQTPGCGHVPTDHNYVRTMDEYVCVKLGCPCTAYLPPRPVPEEGRPEFDSPHMWEEGTADYPVTVTARNAEAEAENAALSARLERLQAGADKLITHGSDCRCYLCIPVHDLRAALGEDA